MARHHHKYYLLLKRKVAPLDALVCFFAVAAPLFEIPQAYTIFSTRSAQDVSLSTWGFFTVSSLVWFIYGLQKRAKMIVLSSGLYFVIELIVVVGILRYM